MLLISSQPSNAYCQGIVVVNLAGPKGGGSLDFTRDIARHATGNDQECVVM
ncbi:hypothetical protein MGL_0700 [Malassezia globosa CBS 7966]|uniref:Uncharacterized protein n=1 Tax=Malassezia globosa (strain ATCC MYA-4612 / CBS 7966) TaxID=425265 RepID=A8PUJ5_MALGO|nr:uncharacterized protein MGL_0700 [Malassezia globosa CBS 7966]EDP44893.1 hypothetical protein MGL_0700 [Malassezia globosa CBS 7966]